MAKMSAGSGPPFWHVHGMQGGGSLSSSAASSCCHGRRELTYFGWWPRFATQLHRNCPLNIRVFPDSPAIKGTKNGRRSCKACSGIKRCLAAEGPGWGATKVIFCFTNVNLMQSDENAKMAVLCKISELSGSGQDKET